MPELLPEDQKKVDEFVSSNVNTIERAAFKPWLLLLGVFAILGGLTLVSYFIASDHGVI